MSETTPDWRLKAETLYEEIGGDLCICQRADVHWWCDKCQQRIDLVEAALRDAARLLEERDRQLADAIRELKRLGFTLVDALVEIERGKA